MTLSTGSRMVARSMACEVWVSRPAAARGRLAIIDVAKSARRHRGCVGGGEAAAPRAHGRSAIHGRTATAAAAEIMLPRSNGDSE